MPPERDHFAAYSFVDRIVEFESGRHGRGTFAIPAALDAFSPALVAEAVGQLAAWVAMDHIDFRGRPVAALATETRFHGDAQPGATLELWADVFACDDDAVAYNGRAAVDGRTVIELIDCLGPMLPVADFDEPQVMRERLALLRDEGATPGRFRGVEPVPVRIEQRVAGVELTGVLDVPANAPFFGDHFPRRPVFPATLLLDTQMRLALELAREAPGIALATPRAVRMTHVKMRSFIVPLQRLEIGVKLAPCENDMLRAMLSATTDERTVASARLELARSAGDDDASEAIDATVMASTAGAIT
jgi:3-hydroxymyristoyl/3-hydroxydecanoyl-(acyl carrier protein) dehydratase